MNCCQCEGIEAKFDEAYVTRRLETYRREGPKQSTRRLIDALRAEPIDGLTLLDIGGGVGDIQHALLADGVATAHNVEVSAAFIEANKRESARLGHADRITHQQGNFVDLAPTIDPADIVTLDRVICCYHDMPRLVGLSAQKARRFYAVVYPLDVWYVKLATALYYNGRHWLRGNPMRNYVFPTEAVEAEIGRAGLTRRFHEVMSGWQVAVFARN